MLLIEMIISKEKVATEAKPNLVCVIQALIKILTHVLMDNILILKIKTL